MFEFGLLFWVAVAFIVLGCGRACGWWRSESYRDRLEKRRRRMEEARGGTRLPRDRTRLEQAPSDGMAREAAGRRTRQLAETPLQALQRKFVQGSITLDEYEQAIDKLKHLD